MDIFNCRYGYNNEIIEFESFIKYDNHNNNSMPTGFLNQNKDYKIPSPRFVSICDTYKQMSVDFNNLADWLWKIPLKNFSQKDNSFFVQYVTKDEKVVNGYRKKDKKGCLEYDTDITKIVIPAHSLKKKVHINSDISIEFCSSPCIIGEYPDYLVQQSSYINIISKKAVPVNSFYHIIYCLGLYFSIIGYGICKINDIYYFEPMKFFKNNKFKPMKRLTFFHNCLPWNIKNDNSVEWSARPGLYYQEIKRDFAKSLKEFFVKKYELRNMLEFLANQDKKYNREYIETYIIQQIQILETYGNIKLKGEYRKEEKGRVSPCETHQDLAKVISITSDDIFDTIFIHNYPNNNYQGWEVFGDIISQKTVLEIKKMLPYLLMEIRNFLVHPCRKGDYKNIRDTKLPEHYILDENRLNLRAVSALSVSLNFLLRWLVLKEIGLEKYFSI